MPLYFAYGSNLLSTRLIRRCPKTRLLGTARLHGWQVNFTKYSWMDGSGKATIDAHASAQTEGVLYDLPSDDLDTLDQIEGVGKGYDRIEISVQKGQSTHQAATYVASRPRADLAPFDWYIGLILAGCAEHRLNDETARRFRAIPAISDPEPDRPSQIEAETLLTHAAGPAWRSNLQIKVSGPT